MINRFCKNFRVTRRNFGLYHSMPAQRLAFAVLDSRSRTCPPGSPMAFCTAVLFLFSLSPPEAQCLRQNTGSSAVGECLPPASREVPLTLSTRTCHVTYVYSSRFLPSYALLSPSQFLGSLLELSLSLILRSSEQSGFTLPLSNTLHHSCPR